MSRRLIPKVLAALLSAVSAAGFVAGASFGKGTTQRSAATAIERSGQMLADNQGGVDVRSHDSGIVSIISTAIAHEDVGQPPCTWAPQDSAGDACGLCGNGGPGTGRCTLTQLRKDVAWCARAWKYDRKAYGPNDDKCHDEAIFLGGLGHAPRWYAGCIGGAATGARFIEGEPWNSLVGCLIGVGFAYIF